MSVETCNSKIIIIIDPVQRSQLLQAFINDVIIIQFYHCAVAGYRQRKALYLGLWLPCLL